MFSFEVDTDEADAGLIEADAVHEAVMLVTPNGFTLEEIVEWEDADFHLTRLRNYMQPPTL
jgi:hypothetical protein